MWVNIAHFLLLFYTFLQFLREGEDARGQVIALSLECPRPLPIYMFLEMRGLGVNALL